jgi:aldehyde dehydrogenase (NAD+)
MNMLHKIFVGGSWMDPQSEQVIEIVDPSTGKVVGEMPRGTAADVDLAVKAARKCFDGAWGNMAAADRGRLLMGFARILESHQDELVEIESRDVGKPLTLARKEIGNLIRNFEFYAGAADKLHGETIPFMPGDVVLLLREPLGVTGHIIPWNGPATIFGRTVAASLAAGNTCVIKPAEDACLSIIRIAELAETAGFPAGVLNIVTGYGWEAGAALTAHPGIDHISFTGSPEVGTLVQQSAAVNHVPVVLELGGKSPNILFEDADIDKAVGAIAFGITINAGQVCAAGSRVLIQRSIYEKTIEKLADRFSKLRAGPPSEDLDLGPLISRKQLDRVHRYLSRADTDKLRIAGEGRLSEQASAGGFFQAPILLRDVSPDHALAQEEIFGPVLVAIPFDTEEDAIRIANGTPYGLVAGVWTREGARQFRMATRVRSGQVFINSFLAGSGVELPFGGSGKSGHGREKGIEALRALTKTKTVVFRNT